MSDMTGDNRELLQPVDADARRLAKTLLRTARFASLGVIDSSDGSPAVSRINVATMIDGSPLFLISRLSEHFGALEADPRAAIMVGEPGRGDPIAHPRLAITGFAAKADSNAVQASLRGRFLAKHPKSALYVDFADFSFWTLTPERVRLNGGFGKAFVLEPRDIATEMDSLDELASNEAGAVAHMNEDHGDAIEAYARMAGETDTGWRLACLDPEGVDLVRGDSAARVWFETPMRAPSDLRPTLVNLAKRART